MKTPEEWNDTNARDELNDAVLESGLRMEWATVERRDFRGDVVVSVVLYPGYTHDEHLDFENGLNFMYDSGYGEQELFGFIGLSCGAWLERKEHDGSECWAFKQYPNAPVRP
jgi:hypothetical protein